MNFKEVNVDKIYRSIARNWSPGADSAMERFCSIGRFFTETAKVMVIEEAMLAKSYADDMGWNQDSEDLADLIEYTRAAPVYNLQ